MLKGSRKYRFLFASAMFGGNTSLFQSMKEMLSEREEFDSAWLLMEEHPKGLITRIPPISMNWTLKGGLSMRSRILALEKQGHRFDAAYFNHLVPAIFLSHFRRRVPSIIALDVTPPLLDIYGKWYSVPPTSKINPLEKVKYNLTHRAYHDAKYLMPFSEWVSQSLQRDYGVPSENIRVNPAGINVEKWLPPDTRTSSNGPVRILFVGSDFERKGGDLVLKLAAQPEFSSCEFHFLSYNDFQPLSSNVVVHTNVKPNTDDLRHLYQQSDIFLLPSRGDLSPIAILEAMAMELPVITTTVGGIPEIVSEGTSGFLVPPDDETALAHRLGMLITDRDLRVRLGKQGRRIVEEHFNLKKATQTIIDHLKRAADNIQVMQLNIIFAFVHSFTQLFCVSFVDACARCHVFAGEFLL